MENYVKINHLYKTFKKGKDNLLVLNDINFAINEGEFVCIVGGSGCGKSTTLRILVGLDTEYSGEVLVQDVPVSGASRDRGVIFQEPRLFPWLTVEENISYSLGNLSKKEKKEKTREMINLVGLIGFEKAYPKQLSGGMAQRTNIARALANKPRLLLLDEPFSALDAFTKMTMQREICRIREAEKSTMIMVTHDIEEAVYLADRVVMFSSRPGSVKQIVPVNLPHPRNRNSEEFVKIKKIIFDEFFDDDIKRA
jgi:sulfonate transport system ATP-binding protein